MFTSFISYRRDNGGTFALLLEEKLTKLGFSPFLDHKDMHSGRFDREITQTIDDVADFIVIFSKDCFIPHGKEDYFFSEIEHAVKKGKHIIPVFLKDYKEPTEIPENISAAVKYQGVKEPAPEDFEAVFIPKLISYFSDTEEKEKYLKNIGARSFITSRREIEQESLDARWKDAVEIDICSYFANMLITSDHINQALAKGVHIKYLIVDPDCAAAKEAMKYRLKMARMSLFRYSYDAAIELLHDMKDENSHFFDSAFANGEFELRKTSLYIGQAIMIVKKKNKSENTVKIDLYTFDTDDTNRRSILISAADAENYEFFCNQFDYIWNAPETQTIDAEQEI